MGESDANASSSRAVTGRAPPRPRRGLPPEEALERWSDPEAYAAMREYWDARQPVSGSVRGPPAPKVLRHREYRRRRDPLEEALQKKLATGELAVSVLKRPPDPQAPRMVVHPATFEDSEIDYEFDEIVGEGLSLTCPEVFAPDLVPLNVTELPDWYGQAFGVFAEPEGNPASAPRTSQLPTFRHSQHYRYVELRGIAFSLSPTQAKIVRHLHSACKARRPWVQTRDLLGAANSASEKVAQIFRRHKDPHWTRLIGSDGKGNYWLRIEDPGDTK